MTQETIKWNGEFGKKCNLPIDCIHCDIIECLGREEENEPFIKGKHPIQKPKCFGNPEPECVKVCVLEPYCANACLKKHQKVSTEKKGET